MPFLVPGHEFHIDRPKEDIRETHSESRGPRGTPGSLDSTSTLPPPQPHSQRSTFVSFIYYSNKGVLLLKRTGLGIPGSHDLSLTASSEGDRKTPVWGDEGTYQDVDQPQLPGVPTLLPEPLFHTGRRGLRLEATAVAIQAVMDLWGHPSSESQPPPGAARRPPGPWATCWGQCSVALLLSSSSQGGFRSAPLASWPALQELFAHASGQHGCPANTHRFSYRTARALWPEAAGPPVLSTLPPGRPTHDSTFSLSGKCYIRDSSLFRR